MINNLSSKATEAATDAIAKSKEAAKDMTSTENVLKAAAMAQKV